MVAETQTFNIHWQNAVEQLSVPINRLYNHFLQLWFWTLRQSRCCIRIDIGDWHFYYPNFYKQILVEILSIRSDGMDLEKSDLRQNF